MPKKRTKKLKKNHTESFSVTLTRVIGTPISLIIHTLLFVGCFVFVFLGYEPDRIMLVLTTLVSLEAIYLSILIQMTVNRNLESLKEVEEDIDEIQENVEELSEGIEEDSEKEEESDRFTRVSIDKIESSLQKIINEIEAIKAENSGRGNEKTK